MLNQCNFIGRLGKDVDVRYTQSGKMVCSFSLAVSDGYGENKKTEWVNCLAWEKLAELCKTYLHKGSLCFVSGRMQTRSYDDKDGNKKYVTELIANNMRMLDKREEPAPAAQEDDVPF